MRGRSRLRPGVLRRPRLGNAGRRASAALVSDVLVPLRGEGVEPGFLKIMRDRTERREGDERQRVLLHELAHRVKNSLAVVLAIAKRTGDRSADLAGFLEDFEGRLLALAAAHDLLSESGWLGTPLAALARVALAPHGDGGEGRVRIEVEGDPALKPAAAQSLAMALHELATNAARHGALSAPGGSVTLEGRVEGGDLVVAWREAGGPPVAGPPGRRGFGSELLERVLAHQHGARTAFEWRPEGLLCTVRLPLAEIAAATRLPDGGG
jgi:two-component sensor histidine kinase